MVAEMIATQRAGQCGCCPKDRQDEGGEWMLRWLLSERQATAALSVVAAQQQMVISFAFLPACEIVSMETQQWTMEHGCMEMKM